MKPHRSLIVFLVALAALGSCGRRRASADECQRIFARLIAVELAERGFRDPVLRERRTEALSNKLAPQMASCVGRPLPASALACIESAPNAEAIVHGCLR